MASDEAARRLIKAWEAWDRHPGWAETAAAMEEACKAYAPGQVLELRRHLAAIARMGGTREEALVTWRLKAARLGRS